jgi:hypothetical protein
VQALLPPYDLRHTFATRLLEAWCAPVCHFGIDRSLSFIGGNEPWRSTLGYARVSWEVKLRALEVLELSPPSPKIIFGVDSGNIPADSPLVQKAG